MTPEEIIESAQALPTLPPSPDRSKKLLGNLHLRSVWQIATAVMQTQEASWDIAWGLATAVSGAPPDAGDADNWGEHSPGSRAAWWQGYELGQMMVLAVGGLDPAPDKLPGLDTVDREVAPGDITEWIDRWRSSIVTDA